jgi:hypothetical protein
MTPYPIELIREILAPMQTKHLSPSSLSRTFGKFARECPATVRAKNTSGFRRRLQKADRGR